MGYAMPTQIGHGIHLRQYSRAFIIASSDLKKRVVFVNADICMGTQIMKSLVQCYIIVTSMYFIFFFFFFFFLCLCVHAPGN